MGYNAESLYLLQSTELFNDWLKQLDIQAALALLFYHWRAEMAPSISSFDIAQHLESDEDIQTFLTLCALQGSAAEFVHALGTAARAKGMTRVAQEAGLTRASLYKALHADGNPEFETIFRVCGALGLRLVPQAHPADGLGASPALAQPCAKPVPRSRT